MSRCELCGEPMPAGEEMFKYHGYSGPCPKPPKREADAAPRPSPSAGELIKRWLDSAREADRLAAKYEALSDGANSHAFRKERRIWTTCADELRAVLADPPVAPAICGVVGEPEAGRMVCELPVGHDGYHQQGRVRWLGYHPKSVAPASPETPRENNTVLGEGLNLAQCLDCGLPYSEFPLDVALPRSQWLDIHPDEHGLLCAACIVKRAAKVPGCTVVHMVLEVSPRPRPEEPSV